MSPAVEAIYKLLSILIDGVDISRQVARQSNTLHLSPGNQALLEIDKQQLRLCDTMNLTSKIMPVRQTKMAHMPDLSAFQGLIAELSEHIIRLNHLGISYAVPHIQTELEKYIQLTRSTSFNVYEEASGMKRDRWFFVGDISRLDNPLFELVLAERKTPRDTQWMPHFQIDIDTDLSMQQLEAITDKHLGKGFFTWKLDVDNYGVIVAMGKLADIYGTKIYLGLATNLRDNVWHRERQLQHVSSLPKPSSG